MLPAIEHRSVISSGARANSQGTRAASNGANASSGASNSTVSGAPEKGSSAAIIFDGTARDTRPRSTASGAPGKGSSAAMIRDGPASARYAAVDYRSAVWNGEPTSAAAGGNTTSGVPTRIGSVADAMCSGQDARYAAADHRSAVWNGEPPSVAAEGATEENLIPIHDSYNRRSERKDSPSDTAGVSAQTESWRPARHQVPTKAAPECASTKRSKIEGTTNTRIDSVDRSIGRRSVLADSKSALLSLSSWSSLGANSRWLKSQISGSKFELAESSRAWLV